MRMCGHKQTRRFGLNLRGGWRASPLLLVFVGTSANIATAQAAPQADLSQQIQNLTDAMARTQTQLEQSQRQLDEMRKQLSALQRQMAQMRIERCDATPFCFSFSPFFSS